MSSRAISYRLLPSFEFKSYQDAITVKKFRTALTRLRLSSHSLCIETGRYLKSISTPINDRKCPFCNILEDEFVFQCPLYADYRSRYIPSYFQKCNNVPKCKELMKTGNKSLPNNLAIFTYKGMNKRNVCIKYFEKYIKYILLHIVLCKCLETL